MPDDPIAAAQDPARMEAAIPSTNEAAIFARERYVRAQWAQKGESLAQDARPGIDIAALSESAIERNDQLDAPAIIGWVEQALRRA